MMEVLCQQLLSLDVNPFAEQIWDSAFNIWFEIWPSLHCEMQAWSLHLRGQNLANAVSELLHPEQGTLPLHLRSQTISRQQLQSGLKTHLFKRAYIIWLLPPRTIEEWTYLLTYLHLYYDDAYVVGRLLTVETVSMPIAKTNHVISHVTRWHDNVDVDNAYAFTLRVFTVTDHHHQLHHHHQQQQQSVLQLHGPLKPVVG